MSATEHKACYGTMFPDPLHATGDRRMQGKVFSCLLPTAGGFSLHDPSVSADIAEWDDCRQCPEFTHCYQLCLAKVALQAAMPK